MTSFRSSLELGLTCGELADVVADADEHVSSFQVVAPLHVDLKRGVQRSQTLGDTCLTPARSSD